MADVRPFRGLRFDPRRVDVGAVLCPPFDVMSPSEQRDYHARDPHNVVRIELGPGPADPTAPGNRYDAAAQVLKTWRAEGVLVEEERPAFYLHEHTFPLGGKSVTRRGVIVVGRLHAWDAGQVLPHEGTRAGPKQDRLALMRATHANVSPLWLLYDDADRAVSGALSSGWALDPIFDASADGERHVLRALVDPSALRGAIDAFERRPLYIADGHHRYETAQHYRDERRAVAGPGPDAGHEFAMMLLVALGDPGLVVLPTHRLVRGLDPTAAELRTALAHWMTVSPLADEGTDDVSRGASIERRLNAAEGHAFALMDGDGTWLLAPRADQNWRALLPAGHSDAWRELDVSVLDAIAIREVCDIR